MRTGFRLELPNGQAFETATEVVSQIQREPRFFFDGAQNLTALYNQATDGGSQSGTVYAGTGATIQKFEIQFTQHEGSTDEWGMPRPTTA